MSNGKNYVRSLRGAMPFAFADTRKAAELNEAGARVVAKLGGIATNDLFRLLDPLDRKSAWRDDYHFTAGTSADIARRVADCVLEAAGLAPRCVSGGIRPVTGYVKGAN